MRSINLSNEKKRDALVGFEGDMPKNKISFVLKDGSEKKNIRILKETADSDINALLKKYNDLEKIADAIMKEDSEIELDKIGMLISHTDKVYFGKDNNIAYHVKFLEIIKNPDGIEKERKPYTFAEANIAAIPLRWTGKIIPKDQAVKMFVFSKKYQIKHVNGLTYDFLYDMAKQLHEASGMMLIGAGEKGTDPLIFSNGGTPYRAFLEGRIQGDKYCLIMHLSNLEMKEITK